jgi:CheY-like chemotaxis protein
VSHKVLVVDDEDHIREVTELALAAVAGWEVVTASSGQEALDKAASEMPEAILMDVMMPDMDGPTTFARLREQEGTGNVPVVFLTAKIQEADRERFAHLGVAGVISKPFDPMTLASEVASLLGWDA